MINWVSAFRCLQFYLFSLYMTFHSFNTNTLRKDNYIERRLFHRQLSVSRTFAFDLLLTARSSEAVSLLSVNYHLTVARHYIVDVRGIIKFWLLRAKRVQEMILRANADVWRIVQFFFYIYVCTCGKVTSFNLNMKNAAFSCSTLFCGSCN